MSDGDKCVPPQWRHWQGRAQFLCSAQVTICTGQCKARIVRL